MLHVYQTYTSWLNKPLYFRFLTPKELVSFQLRKHLYLIEVQNDPVFEYWIGICYVQSRCFRLSFWVIYHIGRRKDILVQISPHMVSISRLLSQHLGGTGFRIIEFSWKSQQNMCIYQDSIKVFFVVDVVD